MAWQKMLPCAIAALPDRLQRQVHPVQFRSRTIIDQALA
jgi:hypothetical protein